jgi:hypothetical protein
MEESHTLTVTLSITIPSLGSALLFALVYILRKRQRARRNRDRIDIRGIRMQNLSVVEDNVEEINNLISSPLNETMRVTRSQSKF